MIVCEIPEILPLLKKLSSVWIVLSVSKITSLPFSLNVGQCNFLSEKSITLAFPSLAKAQPTAMAMV